MKLVFIKLGGSLITNKDKPRTPRHAVLTRVIQEIKSGINKNKDIQVLIGHGSGSFGHVSAQEHKTRDGVFNRADWNGFAQVWHDASALNRIVIDTFHEQRLSAVAFPPSASVITQNQNILEWDIKPLVVSIEAGLIPVIYGDVIFDTKIGGTILSTEELFLYLAKKFHPQRILIAGEEQGVYADYPSCKTLIPEITPKSISQIIPALKESATTDVTGGMYSKVTQMVRLVKKNPEVRVSIFSGMETGAIEQSLSGEFLGTTIYAGKND